MARAKESYRRTGFVPWVLTWGTRLGLVQKDRDPLQPIAILEYRLGSRLVLHGLPRGGCTAVVDRHPRSPRFGRG